MSIQLVTWPQDVVVGVLDGCWSTLDMTWRLSKVVADVGSDAVIADADAGSDMAVNRWWCG